MTNDAQLADAFPKQIERIRKLAEVEFLNHRAECSAPYTLAAAFDWYGTNEGWDYWNDLYRSGSR